MPATITVKPANHKIHSCPQEKKVELLEKIIDQNSTQEIVVVCSKDVAQLQESLSKYDVKVVEDKELVQNKSLTAALIISYDMPAEPIVYIERVSRAQEKALMLVNEDEQRVLYKIEMLLGRAIKQEKVEGFEYPQKAKKTDKKPARKKLSKEEIKEVAKKRYEDSTREAPKFDKEKPERRDDKKPKGDFKKEFKKGDKKDDKPKRAPKVTGKKIFMNKVKKEKR